MPSNGAMVSPDHTCPTGSVLIRNGRMKVLLHRRATGGRVRARHLHVLYGEAPTDRVDELKELATWRAEWPTREKEWSEHLITLGDFNIDAAAIRFGKR